MRTVGTVVIGTKVRLITIYSTCARGPNSRGYRHLAFITERRKGDTRGKCRKEVPRGPRARHTS